MLLELLYHTTASVSSMGLLLTVSATRAILTVKSERVSAFHFSFEEAEAEATTSDFFFCFHYLKHIEKVADLDSHNYDTKGSQQGTANEDSATTYTVSQNERIVKEKHMALDLSTYDRHKKKAMRLLTVSGVQFPIGVQVPDGFVKSITDPLSKVKNEYMVLAVKSIQNFFIFTTSNT